MQPIETTSSLAGKWAVVTGSSRGLGRAIALELSASGANVVVHANRSESQANDLAAAICNCGTNAKVITQDLASASGCGEFVTRVWDVVEPDIWVNNAGVDVLTGEAADWSFDEKLAALWRLDVASSVRLSRDVGAKMKQQGRGVILNIGWDQAMTGMEGDSGQMFAATKGAVMSYTLSAAKSLAPEVRVNCIAPGWVKTDWGAAASEYWQRRAAEEALLKRWGTPEDIAKAARFLVSDESAFITGQILNVNGGQA